MLPDERRLRPTMNHEQTIRASNPALGETDNDALHLKAFIISSPSYLSLNHQNLNGSNRIQALAKK
jgi:hypothetical protein